MNKNSVDVKSFIEDAGKEYFGAFCHHISPEFQAPSHIKLLIKKLKEVEEGKIKRLIINMPPRHGKSNLTSKLFPAWFLGKNPNKSLIFTTYSQEFADDFGRQVKNLLQLPEYQDIFPGCKLSMDSKSSRKFSTTQNNNYFAVGAGGPLTGRGGDCIIIDDIHKNRQEANSVTIRKNIIEWYRSTLFTRLSPEGRVIIIQTRWHEEDLSGYLLSHEPGRWEVLSLPALNDGLEALWPERFDYKQLMEIKTSIGTNEWSALYQQSPIPDGGNIIKLEWIKTYRELPPESKIYSWSWDTAIKVGQENDFSVGLLWAECNNGYYLIDFYKNKLEYPELRKMVNALYNKHKSSEVLIEDKASGQQVLQDFKRSGSMPVIAMMPGRDMPNSKEERMRLVSPQFEAGKVFFPHDAPWLSDVMQELVSFPSGKHDDVCDAVTQYLARRLSSKSKAPNIRIL